MSNTRAFGKPRILHKLYVCTPNKYIILNYRYILMRSYMNTYFFLIDNNALFYLQQRGIDMFGKLLEKKTISAKGIG